MNSSDILPENQTVVLRFVIPNKKSGVVIGKGGSHIKATRERSGARVNVSDGEPGFDRVVTITGKNDQVQTAYTDIMNNLAESAVVNGTFIADEVTTSTDVGVPLANHKGEMVLVLLVANNKVGGIIGLGGSTIDQIRQTSGAFIKVASQDETPPGVPDRLVTLKGSQENVDAAQQMITIQLAKTQPRGVRLQTHLNSSYMNQHNTSGGHAFRNRRGGDFFDGTSFGRTNGVGRMFNNHSNFSTSDRFSRLAVGSAGDFRKGQPSQGGMNSSSGGVVDGNFNAERQNFGRSASGSNATLGSSVLNVVTMEVPDEHTGRLIGRQGACIKEMRSISGASIEVDRRGDNANAETRTVTISGTPDQIQVAQYLISMKLVQAQQQQREAEAQQLAQTTTTQPTTTTKPNGAPQQPQVAQLPSTGI
eukprot:g1482.t1